MQAPTRGLNRAAPSVPRRARVSHPPADRAVDRNTAAVRLRPTIQQAVRVVAQS